MSLLLAHVTSAPHAHPGDALLALLGALAVLALGVLLRHVRKA